LGEVADAEAAAGRDVSGVRLILIGEDFEKRNFCASVPPNETDFFAGRNCDRDAIEEGLRAVSEAEFACGKKSHRLRLEGWRSSKKCRALEIVRPKKIGFRTDR
jgi:hypothetical protein|tara:strand:- start:9662 stop:9973 length:312 start_codon:yes stop_codon:yes gene_type:complete